MESLDIFGKGVCISCGAYCPWTFMNQVMTDGRTHVLKVCLGCKKRASDGWTARDFLIAHGVDPSTLPVHTPEWQDDDHLNYCARCGKAGAQNHHYAPQALFPDADDWPQGFLCMEHHREWHNKLDNRLRDVLWKKDYAVKQLRLLILRLEGNDDK